MPAAPPVSSVKLILTGLHILFWPVLMLAVAGDWRWPEGLVFGAWFVAMSASVIVWLYRKDPALLAERYRLPGSEGQSVRDMALSVLLFLGFLAWLVLLPLDARRLHLSPRVPLAVEILGGALLAPSWYFLFRALADNTFASGLVRIQREREHRVVSTGVYGLVRHPMYLGAVLMFAGGSLLTGALVALGAGVAVTMLLVARIRLEERLLVAELPGYDDYRRRVRHRLIPFVW